MDDTKPPRSDDKELSEECTSTVTKDIVILVCSDNQTYTADESLTRKSELIKNFINYSASTGRRTLELRLSCIPSHILDMVIEYCRECSKCRTGIDLADTMKLQDEQNKWDAKFINVNRKSLYDLIWAAQFLHIESLIKLTSRAETTLTKIILVCSDNKMREADKPLTDMSEMIKNFKYHNADTQGGVLQLHLPFIPSHVLEKVMQYCKKHIGNSNIRFLLDRETRMKQDDELNEWESNFVKIGRSALYDLLWAAQFLKIERMVELTRRAVADLSKAGTKRKEPDTALGVKKETD